MDYRYYTVTPDGDFMLWNFGFPPDLSLGPENITGDTWRLRMEFQTLRLIFVPWDVVQIVNG